MRNIAISDIHGCAKTFRYLVQERVKLQLSDQLFLLGDYIDRGPDSKGVIDFIFELKDKGYQVTCLKGNHELMLLDSLEEASYWKDVWLKNGGDTTLGSFGVEETAEIPQVYLDFFRELLFYHEVDRHILVHAGLNFKAVDPLIDREAMMWARRWEKDIDYFWLMNRKIIYGHSPKIKSQIETGFRMIGHRKYLCIDAGCVYTERPGFGHLCAYDFTNNQLYFCSNKD